MYYNIFFVDVTHILHRMKIAPHPTPLRVGVDVGCVGVSQFFFSVDVRHAALDEDYPLWPHLSPNVSLRIPLKLSSIQSTVIHDFEKQWIEMPDGGANERFIHLSGYTRMTGTHKQSSSTRVKMWFIRLIRLRFLIFFCGGC